MKIENERRRMKNMLLVLAMASVVFTSFLLVSEASAQSISDKLDKAFEKVSEKSSKAAEKLREVANKIGGSGGGNNDNGGCGRACG